jgi:uncharacterized protein with GYD domain
VILTTTERRGIVSTYILLLTLTPEGRQWMLDDPESLQRAEEATAVAGVEILGLYGVLGDYDFVSIVEAPDNESVAAFSLELGVRAGAHIATLPAIPIARFESDPRIRAAAADRVRDVRGEPVSSERDPRSDS